MPLATVSAVMTDSTFLDLLAPYLVPAEDGRHRLFHGRGNVHPALNWLTIDRFPPVLVATLYKPQPPALIAALQARLTAALPSLECPCLVMQHRYDGDARTEVVVGTLPDKPQVVEGGLRYALDFQRGQNLGFFADMAMGRAWLAERAAGKKVLNLFSFTCSFSVAALAAGASSVVNIDLSKPALALGQKNHALNGLDSRQAHFLPHNIFRSWKKLHSLGRYELIVVDPPSAQKGSFMAEKDYPKVLAKLPKLLSEQAELLICLNAPWLDYAWLEACVAEHLPGATLVGRLPGAPGFAEADEPALKTLYYRYQRPELLPEAPAG